MLTFAGCTSSTLVTPTNQPGKLSIEGFNQRIHDEEVAILFNDSSKSSGKGFRIEHDSASWRETESDSLFHVPIAEIHTISTGPNRFGGGLMGFGAGLAGGALAGLVIASGFEASSESKGLTIALGTAGGAVAGGLIGTVVGIVIVQPHVYEFRNNSSDK